MLSFCWLRLKVLKAMRVFERRASDQMEKPNCNVTMLSLSLPPFLSLPLDALSLSLHFFAGKNPAQGDLCVCK